MLGATDTQLYLRKVATPSQVKILPEEMNKYTITAFGDDFESLYEFQRPLLMPRRVRTIDISMTIMRNCNGTKSIRMDNGRRR